MTAQTRQLIITTAKQLFAHNGYEGFSMRILAKACNVSLSSIYHFFPDKDQLLKQLFDDINHQLGDLRAELPQPATASQALRQRIEFQFTYIEDVVFVLKYYLHFRPDFLRLDSGYIPSKAYLHIDEVLRLGQASGEFAITEADVPKESKVIAHAINGFLLEYYPDSPDGAELEELIQSIHSFLIRSLTNKEVPMV